MRSTEVNIQDTSCSDALVVIQRNPTSGSGRGAREIRNLISELRSAGYRVRLFADRDRLDEFVGTAKNRRHINCLVAAGGDGTVASLANRHAEFPIAVLPLGTENLVARYLRIPRCGRTVADLIKRNNTRLFDTAFVNDQRFLVVASAGLDAEVVRRLTTRRTGNISHLSYIRPILGSIFGYGFPEVSVHDSAGQLLASGTHVMVTNIPEYGFKIPFCPLANPFDGKLDIRVFRRGGAWNTFRHVIRTWLGWPDRTEDVVRLTSEKVELRSGDSTVPMQFDGDPADNCPGLIRVDPKSMTLVVHPQPPVGTD